MSLRSLFLFLSLCVIGWAQVGQGVILRGEIEDDGGSPAGTKYVVEISECAGGGDIGRTTLGFDNNFEFRDLKAGCKIVRVLSSDERHLLHEERVLAQNDNVPVLIHLGNVKSRREKIPPAGSAFTVSADGLRHPIPPKILRALVHTQRLTEAGRLAEASSELHKIVAHNPNVWQARLNLGVVEMKLGLTNEALTSFTKARELEPRSSKAALDSAIALVTLRRVGEAESAAREALKLDPSNNNAQQLLDLLHVGRERGYIKTSAGPE
jgi:hypothetical protein